MDWTVYSLFFVVLLVLLLPFSVKHVEEKLEAFLFVMGALAMSISGRWSQDFVVHALKEPLGISLAVLVAGFGFRALRPRMKSWIQALKQLLGLRLLFFFLVAGLGLLSSLITAVIAALVLAEAVSILKLPRKPEIRLVVLACFGIGMGAMLTPLGEPLSTITVAKLQGEPYHADFWFLFRLLGSWILPLLALFSLLAALLPFGEKAGGLTLKVGEAESAADLWVRSGKVYIFVLGLMTLGEGLSPLATRYLAQTPASGLFWMNSLSAALDNATLAAAEIGPWMSLEGIRTALLGLLIAGGMLIPGNLPNIICASKLGIRPGEWARHGLPLGLAVMAGVFLLLNLGRF